MKQTYYSYHNYLKDAEQLISSIEKKFIPDAIIAIARSGFTLSQSIAETLEIRDLFSISSKLYNGDTKMENIQISEIPLELKKFKKILVVDDITDSGETMSQVVNKVRLVLGEDVDIKTATLFHIETSIFKPDFYVKTTNDWIHFFWNTDLAVKMGKKDKKFIN